MKTFKQYITEKVEHLDMGSGSTLKVTHISSADHLKKHVGNTTSGATRTISYSNGKTVAWDAHHANHSEVSSALHGEGKYNPDKTTHGHHEEIRSGNDEGKIRSNMTYEGGKKNSLLSNKHSGHHLVSAAKRTTHGTDGKGNSVSAPKKNFPHDHANEFLH